MILQKHRHLVIKPKPSYTPNKIAGDQHYQIISSFPQYLNTSLKCCLIVLQKTKLSISSKNIRCIQGTCYQWHKSNNGWWLNYKHNHVQLNCCDYSISAINQQIVILKVTLRLVAQIGKQEQLGELPSRSSNMIIEKKPSHTLANSPQKYTQEISISTKWNPSTQKNKCQFQQQCNQENLCFIHHIKLIQYEDSRELKQYNQ